MVPNLRLLSQRRVLVWVNSGRYHIITQFAVPLVYQAYILTQNEPLSLQGPGLRWFDAHDLAVSVVEEISSGQKFVVSASVVPEILDVQCTAPDQTDLRWSRISGDVLVAGGARASPALVGL